jgi:hypothetical protein
MKRHWVLIPLFACSCPGGASGEDWIHTRPVAEVLGATHVSGRYYFSGDDFLNEGADRLLELGMGVFKGWLTPGTPDAYPYNSDWPKGIETLVELVQTPYYRKLLDKPFSTFVFVVTEFCRPQWREGLDGDTAAAVEAENYALAAYLLTRYKNTGKTFILQNWEGDNALRAWEIKDPEAYRVARQGMIDWLNARQAGIERARRKFGMEGVRVAGAVEITRTPAGRRPFEHPLVVDDVVPHTKADLYSFSTWGTRLPGDEKLLLAQLDHIAERAPASELYGDRNVMLGEFGAYELTYTHPQNNYPAQQQGAEAGVFNEASARGQLMASRKQLEYALQWGVHYALYWELYCNGLRDGIRRDRLPKDGSGQRVATADHLKGVWLIRPDGSKTPTWHYFANLLNGGYIADCLTDWSRVMARSARLQRAAGGAFVGNQSERPSQLVYNVEGLASASVRILQHTDHPAGKGVRLLASVDRENWTRLRWSYASGPSLEGAGWSYGHLLADPASIPDGAGYFKVELDAGTAAQVLLDKVVAEGRDVAVDPERGHYRFAELDGLLVNGKPVEGFDPVVTRYALRRPDAGEPLLEWIPADPRLQVKLLEPVDAGWSSRLEVAFPGESPRVYEVDWR